MTTVHRSLMAIAFLTLITVPTWAAFIRGQVRYEDGRFADRIVVRLRSDKIAFQTELTTDSQGKFDFDGLAPSTYRLTIEGQGIRAYESVIDITVSKMSYEQITLRFAKDRNPAVVPPKGRARAWEPTSRWRLVRSMTKARRRQTK